MNMKNIKTMKYLTIIFALSISFNAIAQDAGSGGPMLKNASDSVDFYFGVNLGYSMENNPYVSNYSLMLIGFITALENKATLDTQAAQDLFRALVANRPVEVSPQEEEAAENLEKGRAFLAENGKREGVITTASGLQYEVIKEGDGEKPTATSEVEVHYEGTLLDGTVFDSSYDRGESITFPLNRVIPGWTEGVQLMPVGSTYKFYIPSVLGYGARSVENIPSNSTLIFKIELLGIKK
jgi:FKBP-type peptidyl-prolyl cis-trans isomerase FkpA